MNKDFCEIMGFGLDSRVFNALWGAPRPSGVKKLIFVHYPQARRGGFRARWCPGTILDVCPPLHKPLSFLAAFLLVFCLFFLVFDQLGVPDGS